MGLGIWKGTTASQTQCAKRTEQPRGDVLSFGLWLWAIFHEAIIALMRKPSKRLSLMFR
jgi:hypothetical protein